MSNKEKVFTSADGMILIDYPKQNDITFCADLPFIIAESDFHKVMNIVTAVKHNDMYLTDILGSANINYPRENKEGHLRVVATVSFPEGIPAGYRSKIESYQNEDFTVEYHEEVVVKA
jgi:hypothetical protein